MPTLDDVYRKFGETAEAAQLLETQLGTMLLINRGAEAGLIVNPDSEHAADLYASINRHTLGQIIKGLNGTVQALDSVDSLLSEALRERNRLFHEFYRHHNFRRNSDDGRTMMLEDLDSVHDIFLRAYKAVMLLDGVDLDALVDAAADDKLPTGHVSI